MRKINDGLTAMQRYYKKHKDRCFERSRKWQLANKEKILAYQRERRKNFPKPVSETAKKCKREYYERNRETITAKSLARQRLPEIRYKRAVQYSKRMGLDWNISISDFYEFISKRCSYCDGSLPHSGHGLDRMDNSRGYVIGNVVPCCTACNRMKNSFFTYEEMIVAMNAVKKYRLSKIMEGV